MSAQHFLQCAFGELTRRVLGGPKIVQNPYGELEDWKSSGLGELTLEEGLGRIGVQAIGALKSVL